MSKSKSAFSLATAARNCVRLPFSLLLEFLYQRSSKPAQARALQRQMDQWARLLQVPIYCGNVDEWHAYFDRHHDRLPGLLAALQAGTDERSREELALFYERYRHVFPPSRFQGQVFFDPDTILTPAEKAAARELKEFAAKPSEFVFPQGVGNEEPHLFWSQLGLVHLPPAARGQIRDGDVIDGGAYCGDSAMVFTKYQPRSIHAFEAFPASVELLKQMIALNHMEGRILPVGLGLGRAKGSLNMTRRVESGSGMDVQLQPGEAAVPPGRKVVGTVGVTTIDDYVAEHQLRPVAIKLDVEGAEYSVIEGALKTIRDFHPILLISIYHRPQDFFEIRPLIETVTQKYEYRFRYLCPTSPSNEFMLIAHVPGKNEDQ